MSWFCDQRDNVSGLHLPLHLQVLAMAMGQHKRAGRGAAVLGPGLYFSDSETFQV